MKPTHIREAEHYRTVWQVTLDKSETLQSALEPTFWCHVASRLRPLSQIEVYAHDASWYARVVVRSIPPGPRPSEARVVLLEHVDLDEAERNAREVAPDTTLEVVWKGPAAKHCVVRKGDKHLVAKGFDSKQAAADWIAHPTPEAPAAQAA